MTMRTKTLQVCDGQAVTQEIHNCRSRENTGAKIQRKLDCSSSLNAGIIKHQNESLYLFCVKSRNRLTITSGTDWWSGGEPCSQRESAFCPILAMNSQDKHHQN